MPNLQLQDEVTQLSGVGAAMAKKLARLNIHTIQDVLFHLPLRYEDRTRVTPIAALMHGAGVVVQGEVISAQTVYRRRRMLAVTIGDASGQMVLRFFHFSQAQKNALQAGVPIRCYGEARQSSSGGFEMVHPEYRTHAQATEALNETLTPIYPSTEGVRQATLCKLSKQALAVLQSGHVRDYFSEWVRAWVASGSREAQEAWQSFTAVQSLDENAQNNPSNSLCAWQWSLKDALGVIHWPAPDVSLHALIEGEHPAQQRLAMEELLAHHISMQNIRKTVQRQPARIIDYQPAALMPFLNGLGFALTGAQQCVLDEIQRDIKNAYPTLRLVQGDVGSGKTVVAAGALIRAAQSGWQSALMAPTELLAEQHFANMQRWCEPLGITVGWLSGQIKGKQRQATLDALATGAIHILIGTHALFQDAVVFQSLVLLVVDEQHRFGVHQRLALQKKGRQSDFVPHQIIMTATPIPRTLAMTAYADLDYSVIDELPPNRTPVNTVVLNESKRDAIIQRIQAACSEGKQAYWVCTLIEESESLQCQAAEDTALLLAQVMPTIRVGLVHGRMKATEKAQVMEKFKIAELDLLVATTVIEVGVDVPNASLMIIENAERLGLSQLHQLRGRVGRGAQQSACVLLYKEPLGEIARQRLETMRQSNDGFFIAEQDLQLRGPGEVLGTRQTGEVQFKVADIVRDGRCIDSVRGLAESLDERQLATPDFIKRWISEAKQFLQV